MKVRTQNLTSSAVFIALGILVPIFFHAIGLGPVFLPMFWPIATSAFFLPITYAIAVGAITPILSTLMTGMPPPPILYKMIFELACLSGIISLLYEKTRYGTLWLVLAGLFIAEVTALLSAAAIAPLLGLPPQLYAIASLVKSIPGIVLILGLIPSILKSIKKEPIFSMRTANVTSA